MRPTQSDTPHRSSVGCVTNLRTQGVYTMSTRSFRYLLFALTVVLSMLVSPAYAQDEQPPTPTFDAEGRRIEPVFVDPIPNPPSPMGTEEEALLEDEARVARMQDSITESTQSRRLDRISKAMGVSLDAVESIADNQADFWQYIADNQRQLGVRGVFRIDPERGEIQQLEPSNTQPLNQKRVFFPLITRKGPNTPPPPQQVPLTADELTNRIWAVLSYLDPLCKRITSRNIGVCSEWGGAFPLSIVNNSFVDDPYQPRMAGHYKGEAAPIQRALGRVTYFAIGRDFDWMNIEFEPRATQIWHSWGYDLKLWADRYYYTNGTVTYTVEVQQNTTDDIDLYLNNFVLIEDLSQPLPRIVTTHGIREGFPTLRYMLRIDTQTGRYMKSLLAFTGSTVMLGNALYQYNYLPESSTPGWDYWYSIYGTYAYLPDDAYTQTATYPDCRLQTNGVDSQQPWGGRPQHGANHYNYESKVCTIGVGPWNIAAARDNIMPPNVAIHNLNRYNNPDHPYENPRTYGIGTTTAREEARYLEGLWNGVGIPNWGRDPALASALRTDNFWILETILGYKFGDPTSRYYADMVAEQAMYRVWGMAPYNNETVYTADWGWLVRPTYYGSPFNFWKRENGTIVYARPDSSFIRDVLDVFNMPQEEMSASPIGVYEAGQSYVQAARIYLYYRYNRTWYGTGLLLMPRYDIPLTGGRGNDIAIPWQTGWTARDLLIEINRQGGNAIAVRMKWEGQYRQCTTTNCPDGGVGYYANFPIVAGAGYVVDVNNSIHFRVNGLPFSSTPTINLVGGYAWNQISIPVVHDVRGSLWASDLLTLLQQAGCGNVQIARKSPSGFGIDEWSIYDGVINFPIEMHKAYMVTVQNRCDLNP